MPAAGKHLIITDVLAPQCGGKQYAQQDVKTQGQSLSVRAQHHSNRRYTLHTSRITRMMKSGVTYNYCLRIGHPT